MPTRFWEKRSSETLPAVKENRVLFSKRKKFPGTILFFLYYLFFARG
ncbi:MAG: hypothetical protein IEMM0006_0491 [bacterium]|nr:MAG: hypothetical protein IEMM0006_0491 [bacterium]